MPNGTNLPALPSDVLEDLLRAQAGNLDTSGTQLTKVRILRESAQFEFEDTGELVREFRGVILGDHPKNILYVEKYNAGAATKEKPDCAAEDGMVGQPREGFPHLALRGAPATGEETIACDSCPYNKFDTAKLIGKDGKGKACANKRSVFVLIEGRMMPVNLDLPPTSLRPFNAFMTMLTNQGMPALALVTNFALKKDGNKSVLVATMGPQLDSDSFHKVLDARKTYKGAMEPRSRFQDAEFEVVVDDPDAPPAKDDDDLPF